MADAPVAARVVVRSPACFLALGAGSGLAPRAPGTFGTLAAVPLALLMPQNLLLQIVIVLALFGVGIWCCGRCAAELGVHDHGAIVWDEIVGYLIAMLAVPRTIGFVILGVVLFRIFDITKPWPIGAIDRKVQGGLGIMLDDVIAALFVLVLLQLCLTFGWLRMVPGFA